MFEFVLALEKLMLLDIAKRLTGSETAAWMSAKTGKRLARVEIEGMSDELMLLDKLDHYSII